MKAQVVAVALTLLATASAEAQMVQVRNLTFPANWPAGTVVPTPPASVARPGN